MMPAPHFDLEVEAKKSCRKLLDSKTAQMLPRANAEALIILAFTFGAAWALDRPDMIALAEAQIDARRKRAAVSKDVRTADQCDRCGGRWHGGTPCTEYHRSLSTEQRSVVCQSCHMGLLVFVQTGSVRHPHDRIYKCNCCGTTVVVKPQTERTT